MTDAIASIVLEYQATMQRARQHAFGRFRDLRDKGKITDREYARLVGAFTPPGKPPVSDPEA